MARYSYQAYDQHGQLISGVLEAPSRAAALEALRGQGRFALEIGDGAIAAPDEPWWKRDLTAGATLPLADLATFTREVATLVKADLPLDEVLRIVALQPLMSTRMRSSTRAVLDGVREGASLSGALAATGQFPEYHWRAVEAGESGGSLGGVLDELAGLIERTIETRRQITSALMYPGILMLAAAGSLVVIMGVLVPSVAPLFKDAGAPLPGSLAAMVAMREVLTEFWPLVLAGGAAAAVGLLAAMREPRLRLVRDRLVLRLPLVGRLVQQRETARLARTLSTLTRNGVPLLDAVRISAGVLQSKVYADAVGGAVQSLAEGRRLSEPMLASGLFSELAMRLVAVGEQTGQLDTMLMQVAAIYEATLQRQLSRLMSVLAPVLTLVIGVVVGGLILSVINAIMSVNELVLR